MNPLPVTDLPASLHWQPHPDPLTAVWFIGFGGMQLYQPLPDFEWGAALSALPANVLLVRDPAQFWYLRGLPDLAPDLAGTLDAVGGALARRGAGPSVCVGASTGGYAALLFGALLGTAEVHAFSPMTIIPSRTILEVAGFARTANWSLIGRHITLRRSPRLAAGFRDLRPILQQDNGRTTYHLYYARGHTADRRNARRLDGLPRVTLHPFDDYHHDIVRALRRTGELAAILNEAHGRTTALRIAG
jgi:hypothetical protein